MVDEISTQNFRDVHVDAGCISMPWTMEKAAGDRKMDEEAVDAANGQAFA